MKTNDLAVTAALQVKPKTTNQTLGENITDFVFPEPDYDCRARTNYFAVRDLQAFEEDLQLICGGKNYYLDTKELDGVEVHAVLFATSGLPQTFAYPGEWQEQWVDWCWFFANHLEDDWVAVVMEVEYRGLEEVAGTAYAFNNKMGLELLFLDRILPMATKLGNKITKVSKEAVLYTNNSTPGHIQLEDE